MRPRPGPRAAIRSTRKQDTGDDTGLEQALDEGRGRAGLAGSRRHLDEQPAASARHFGGQRLDAIDLVVAIDDPASIATPERSRRIPRAAILRSRSSASRSRRPSAHGHPFPDPGTALPRRSTGRRTARPAVRRSVAPGPGRRWDRCRRAWPRSPPSDGPSGRTARSPPACRPEGRARTGRSHRRSGSSPRPLSRASILTRAKASVVPLMPPPRDRRHRLPYLRNPRTLRVTRTAPRERDMAAIWQSTSPTGRPARRLSAAISA